VWKKLLFILIYWFLVICMIGPVFGSTPHTEIPRVEFLELTPYEEYKTKIWFTNVWMNHIRFRTFYKYGYVVLPTTEDIEHVLPKLDY
jgi:hypothetical protein